MHADARLASSTHRKLTRKSIQNRNSESGSPTYLHSPGKITKSGTWNCRAMYEYGDFKGAAGDNK